MLSKKLVPMLPTLVSESFESKKHIFEIKWDGIRCLSFVDRGNLRLQSRNLRDITAQFPELNSLPRRVNSQSIILDGELCVLDGEGKPDFPAVLQRIRTRRDRAIDHLAQKLPVTYILWDILYLDGRDLRSSELLMRREHLQKTIQDGPGIIVPPAVNEKGDSLFAMARENNLEGIVAKNIESPYLHRRSRLWLKIKTYRQMSCLIGGYCLLPALSLLLGAHDSEGHLLYMGRVERGLRPSEREYLKERLPSLRRETSPFHRKKTGGNWIEPEIACRVRFLELTPALKLRHATIERLEPDRSPKECRIDRVQSI